MRKTFGSRTPAVPGPVGPAAWACRAAVIAVAIVAALAPRAHAQADEPVPSAGLAELFGRDPLPPAAPGSARVVEEREELEDRPPREGDVRRVTGEDARVRPGLPVVPGVADGEREPVDLDEFEGRIEVSDEGLVDLSVVNQDLAVVLQLLSMQARRNIVSSNRVRAVVTADLYDVTFFEALDAILHVNGFGYVERGNFIFVYTREELAALQGLGRALTSAVIRLDYLNAPDAALFVAPLLSEDGSITAPDETLDFDIPDDAPVGKDDYALDAILVVHDYPENVAAVRELIEQIDTKPEQVLIEATILQTSLTEENAFGVDFSLIADLEFSQFVSPLGVTESLIDGRGSTLDGGAETPTQVPNDGIGRSVTSTVGNTGDTAGIRAGLIGEDVAVFVRALDQVTDVTIISNPKILTLNRQQARVLVGTRFGFLQTTTTETATTQTVEFLDTGTQLHVRPFVTEDRLIRLELKPQVSSASPRTVTAANGLTVTIPDEDTTELVTNLLVRDGQTVVLGGLFTETTTATRRQVPFVGDIPLVGAAFRGQDDSTRRSEIIFLVTPSVVSDDVLTLEGERATEYVEHARAGARKGLLPWSRERRVGRLLIEARRHLDEGEDRKAMLKVERALALHPQSAEAIALRERITSRQTRFPSRSLLDQIVAEEERRLRDLGPIQTDAAAGAFADEDVDPTDHAPTPETETEGERVTSAPIDE